MEVVNFLTSAFCHLKLVEITKTEIKQRNVFRDRYIKLQWNVKGLYRETLTKKQKYLSKNTVRFSVGMLIL